MQIVKVLANRGLEGSSSVLGERSLGKACAVLSSGWAAF